MSAGVPSTMHECYYALSYSHRKGLCISMITDFQSPNLLHIITIVPTPLHTYVLAHDSQNYSVII